MLRVALTGGIGSGKSAVSAAFARRGVPVSDADLISRDLTQPGQAAWALICARFGAVALASDGRLDRAALRRHVLAHPEARAELEAILHPLIRQQMLEDLAVWQSEGQPYGLLVIPLLIEVGQQDLADRILVVEVPPEVQRVRLRARGGLPISPPP